ncbi:hypothetical protein L6164_028277 [Bauhinia variegata]|uniref:Uncharacterized protein n=1 Tax=Bauhinia variegata TaxID=167791 RepID=A0ACB9LVX0_BAUVA|nr:hypothetical protein L6164_028277 [Bauhinia variegata]
MESPAKSMLRLLEAKQAVGKRFDKVEDPKQLTGCIARARFRIDACSPSFLISSCGCRNRIKRVTLGSS